MTAHFSQEQDKTEDAAMTPHFSQEQDKPEEAEMQRLDAEAQRLDMEFEIQMATMQKHQSEEQEQEIRDGTTKTRHGISRSTANNE